MDFNALKNPPKKYRPAPFWSWNEKLETRETKRQIELMDNAGIGGFFMHARGGLQTEYMSKEWFDNIKASIDKSKENGMYAWGYDENGWPSGFGSGAVNGLGLRYQQKYLRCEKVDEPKTKEHTIINVTIDNQIYHMYYDVNPFYVDTLDKEVIAEFIKSTYEKYTEKFGYGVGGMTGFFTDEPQISRNGCPWSFVMEKEYMSRYNESLLPLLPKLFYDLEGYRQVRYRFWSMVTDLFTESYNKQIFDWCNQNGQLYTGHVAVEESFFGQIMSNGACMPLYEYMHIPGMDHLFRILPDLQTEKQLTSVANQLGKKQVLSETFALSGWNVSFEDLRWMYESQMARGINWLCQHLEGYSLRGIRKRDYPASLFHHQPWWKDYKKFNDMVSRIGMLIAEGSIDYKVLLLHNIESGWVSYSDANPNDEEYNTELSNVYCKKLEKTMWALESESIQYHLGDDRIMKRHGSIEDGKLKVGTQNYSVVIVPPSTCIGSNTFALIKEFKSQGGLVIFTDEIPEYVDGVLSEELKAFAKDCVVTKIDVLAKSIPDWVRDATLEYKKGEDYIQPVSLAVRGFKEQGMTMYYIVNPNYETYDLTVKLNGSSVVEYDALSGDERSVEFEKAFDKLEIKTTLYSRGSRIFFVYDDDRAVSLSKNKTELLPITDKLCGDWELTTDDNALTLDYCDVYFDGELFAKNLPISDVQEKACAFERKVKTELVYHFNIKEDGFNSLKLAIETPEIFDITVNGEKLDKVDLGFYHDTAFRLIDIKGAAKLGLNEIRVCCDFVQSEKVYENLKNSLIFESEKNKLSYDMELEAIYLVGDFAVNTDNTFEKLKDRALRTNGEFYICNAPKTAVAGNMAEQGYPFFAGCMTFKKQITLSVDECKNRSFKISRLCSNVTSVKINGKDAGDIMWEPYEIDISNLLTDGENEIEITVTGNLRNLLGPFHLKCGECFAVDPPSFFHESPVWCGGLNQNWVDSYCFVEYGLFF